jgi:hypothetical protein
MKERNSMATYCMGDPYTLFAECSIRGWLQAVLDFPHLKTREECALPAVACSNAMRLETCCITSAEDEKAYLVLVATAWVNSYLAINQASEREIVIMSSALKRLSTEDALQVLRAGIISGDAKG